MPGEVDAEKAIQRAMRQREPGELAKALLDVQAKCEERVHKEELVKQDAQAKCVARCLERTQGSAKGGSLPTLTLLKHTLRDKEQSFTSGSSGFDNPWPGERCNPNNRRGNRTEHLLGHK